MSTLQQIDRWEKTSKLKRVDLKRYREDFFEVHYDNGLILLPHTRLRNYLRFGMLTQHGDEVLWDHTFEGGDIDEGIQKFKEFLRSQISTDPKYADEAEDLQEMVTRLP